MLSRFSTVTPLACQRLGVDLGEDLALGEVGRADDDRVATGGRARALAGCRCQAGRAPPPQAARTRAALASAAAPRAMRDVRIGEVLPGSGQAAGAASGSWVRGDERASRAGAAGAARRPGETSRLLQAGEQQVRDDREQRDEHRAGDHLREVADRQAVDDEPAEAAERDVRRDGRGRDRPAAPSCGCRRGSAAARWAARRRTAPRARACPCRARRRRSRRRRCAPRRRCRRGSAGRRGSPARSIGPSRPSPMAADDQHEQARAWAARAARSPGRRRGTRRGRCGRSRRPTGTAITSAISRVSAV